MTEKNHSLDCHDCEGQFFVDERHAKNRDCPNCHSDNVEILD